jgi:hypothetical protein
MRNWIDWVLDRLNDIIRMDLKEKRGIGLIGFRKAIIRESL